MQSIDIQTTQNVTINYELALLRDRILAFSLDFIIVLAACFFLILLFLVWMLPSMGLDLDQEIWYLFVAPVYTFYTLTLESLCNGQTVGKMALQIKVIRIDGKQAKFLDYLLRWCFRLLDIWFSFGALATVLISSSPKSQRLGDIVANTAVVKASPNLFVSLKDVLKINTKETYEPLYPMVKHFKEADVLLMKQTLERYKKYRNTAHKEALSLLVQRISEKLNLKESPKNPEKFIRTVIKDYIVLTR
jgi:uncharacterized RDD family membrane protein YckC